MTKFAVTTYLSRLLMTSSGHAHLDRHRYAIAACRDVLPDARNLLR